MQRSIPATNIQHSQQLHNHPQHNRITTTPAANILQTHPQHPQPSTHQHRINHRSHTHPQPQNTSTLHHEA